MAWADGMNVKFRTHFPSLRHWLTTTVTLTEAKPEMQKQLNASHFSLVDETTMLYDQFRASTHNSMSDVYLAAEREESYDPIINSGVPQQTNMQVAGHPGRQLDFPSQYGHMNTPVPQQMITPGSQQLHQHTPQQMIQQGPQTYQRGLRPQDIYTSPTPQITYGQQSGTSYEQRFGTTGQTSRSYD